MKKFIGLVFGGICLCLLLATACARAQEDQDTRLQAFKEASANADREQGCLSIPYPKLQEACQTKQKEVVRWCKQSGSFSCLDVDPKTMQADIEAMKKESDVLKEHKEDLEKKRSSASNDAEKQDAERSIKEIENRQYELKQTWERLQARVNDAAKIASDRMYVAKACADARPEVTAIFADARSKADQEQDEVIKQFAQKLIVYWDREKTGHDEQLRTTKLAVENCDKVLYEIGHIGH